MSDQQWCVCGHERERHFGRTQTGACCADGCTCRHFCAGVSPIDAEDRLEADRDRATQFPGVNADAALVAPREPLGQSEMTWQRAAHLVGEASAPNGPDGYYAFTPQQWLEWMRQRQHESAALVAGLRQQLHAWKEVGEEMRRILEFMTAEQREDLCPDWFIPRLEARLDPGRPARSLEET